MAQLEENLARLQDRVKAAAERVGRRAEEIQLMAVSKTRSREEILAAYGLGLRLFGENRVQEIKEKFYDLPGDLELHLLGHLQSNKAKTAAAQCVCIQSIDKWETLEALDKAAEKEGTRPAFLLEINISGEASKSGIRDKVYFFAILEKLSQCKNLRLEGLMGIGPLAEPAAIRASFRALRELRDETLVRYSHWELPVLSMGMSGDFEIAIEEGATLIRVGTLLFGERPPQGSVKKI
jgi:pyridoxal phosphate enzyme (YggS family)